MYIVQIDLHVGNSLKTLFRVDMSTSASAFSILKSLTSQLF